MGFLEKIAIFQNIYINFIEVNQKTQMHIYWDAPKWMLCPTDIVRPKDTWQHNLSKCFIDLKKI